MIIKTITVFLALLLLQFTATAQTTYQLDIKKSKILWNTGKVMGGHNGYLLFTSGTLQYTAAGEPIHGFFTMDMKNIRSTDRALEKDNKKTEETMRTADFFDAEKHPTATMQITKITRVASSDNYTVTGNLTIKGITHSITFTAPIKTDTKANTLTSTADVSIHRIKWNIDVPKNQVTDILSGVLTPPDIHVTLQLVMSR